LINIIRYDDDRRGCSVDEFVRVDARAVIQQRRGARS